MRNGWSKEVRALKPVGRLRKPWKKCSCKTRHVGISGTGEWKELSHLSEVSSHPTL